MKRLISLGLALSMILFITVCFFGCNSNEQGLRGEKGDDEINAADNTSLDPGDVSQKPSHTHSFSNWSEVVEPTCEKEGLKERICEICSYTETSITANTDHTYVSVTVSATCTESGNTTYTCTACGFNYVDDYVAAVGEHSYDDGVCVLCGNNKLGAEWIAPNLSRGDYSMVVLPDTQMLVELWPEFYYKQMQWIADHKDELNIRAVIHMGDMVNVNSEEQWTVCKKGTDILDEAGVVWMPMRGNHDDSAWFNKYYDYSVYGSGRNRFGGSYHSNKLDHTYWFVDAGGREYMILSLGWAPSWDVLRWAQEIVGVNSDKNVIISCHAYMNKDGTLLDSGDSLCVSDYLPNYPNGDDIWNAFKGYKNVVLAMSGHIYSADVVSYVDKNGDGRDVTSLLFDRQDDDTRSRLGMVGVLTFYADSNTVDVNWYSTNYDALYRDKNQFSVQIPHLCDHSYTVETTAANCTQGGGTVYTCKLCEHSYLEKATEPLGHDYFETVIPPSCTAKGYTMLTCSLCGQSKLKGNSIDITSLFIWTEKKMIIATDGQVRDYAHWCASDYVDISDYNIIVIKTANTASVTTTTGLAFYDADKNYISGVKHTDQKGVYGILIHEIEVPENAVYIRSTWYGSEHPNYESVFGDFYCLGMEQYVPALNHIYEKGTCIDCGAEQPKDIFQ